MSYSKRTAISGFTTAELSPLERAYNQGGINAMTPEITAANETWWNKYWRFSYLPGHWGKDAAERFEAKRGIVRKLEVAHILMDNSGKGRNSRKSLISSN